MTQVDLTDLVEKLDAALNEWARKGGMVFQTAPATDFLKIAAEHGLKVEKADG